MSDIEAFAWVAAGVFVALVHPLLLALYRREFPLVVKGGIGIPPWIPKYGGLFLLCILTGAIVLAIYKSTAPEPLKTWFQPFLLGYGWEAFIEKWKKA